LRSFLIHLPRVGTLAQPIGLLRDELMRTLEGVPGRF
jgi:hypothetical protein